MRKQKQKVEKKKLKGNEHKMTCDDILWGNNYLSQIKYAYSFQTN